MLLFLITDMPWRHVQASKKKNIRINNRRIVNCDHYSSIEIIGIKSQKKSEKEAF